MFGLCSGRETPEDERIARLIANATNDNTMDWERYLPAARKLLREFDMGPVHRSGGSMFG